MHTNPIPESAGEFAEWRNCGRSCPKCDERETVYRTWESSCGGYEDDQFKCCMCGHTWWVEGCDA